MNNMMKITRNTAWDANHPKSEKFTEPLGFIGRPTAVTVITPRAIRIDVSNKVAMTLLPREANSMSVLEFIAGSKD